MFCPNCGTQNPDTAQTCTKCNFNIKGAAAVGRVLAQRLKDKGITRVVFDRGGFLYHGRVRAVADAAREAGLEF